MKIRLIKRWRMRQPGEILDPDPPVAALLIERGLAELLTDKAVMAPVADKAVHGPQQSKRKAR